MHKGLLSKEYAKQRAATIQYNHNGSTCGPGDPYPFEGKINPYTNIIKSRFGTSWPAVRNPFICGDQTVFTPEEDAAYHERQWLGTTSIEACDSAGWVVSVTPSGSWLPTCIAGNTGIGMSQRMQSFVLDSTLNPFNVLAPYKKPRVTLTPPLAM